MAPGDTLELQADARPSGSTSAAAALQLRALISPWAALPLPSAELELRDIDLAAFCQQAPHPAAGPLARVWHGSRWRLAAQESCATWLPAPGSNARCRRCTGLHAELVHAAGGSWRLRALDAGLIEGGRKLQATGRWDDPAAQVERAELAFGDSRRAITPAARWTGANAGSTAGSSSNCRAPAPARNRITAAARPVWCSPMRSACSAGWSAILPAGYQGRRMQRRKPDRSASPPCKARPV